MRRALGVAIVAAVIVQGSAARADDPSPEQRARAQELFESGLADVEAGRPEAACPKFAASQSADPKTSTLLNLGRCYEATHRDASAWGAFREAEALARRSGRRDLETAARAAAESVAPKLVRLTIVVPDATRVPGLAVTRDGSATEVGEWGVAIPVDRGEHVIRAQAPGKKPWSASITLGAESRSVTVPSLEGEPAGGPTRTPAMPARASASWWTPLRTSGVVLAGVGGAAMITGSVLGLVAKSSYDDARSTCDGPNACSATAVSDSESARSLANGGTVVFVAGAVLAAGGGALLVFAPSPRVGFVTGPGMLGLRGNW